MEELREAAEAGATGETAGTVATEAGAVVTETGEVRGADSTAVEGEAAGTAEATGTVAGEVVIAGAVPIMAVFVAGVVKVRIELIPAVGGAPVLPKI